MPPCFAAASAARCLRRLIQCHTPAPLHAIRLDYYVSCHYDTLRAIMLPAIDYFSAVADAACRDIIFRCFITLIAATARFSRQLMPLSISRLMMLIFFDAITLLMPCCILLRHATPLIQQVFTAFPARYMDIAVTLDAAMPLIR